MLKIYRSKLDWMNYTLVKKDVTQHHILKKENGGMLEWGNIALLMPQAHRYLHLIEYKDFETYVALNKIFKFINEQMYAPSNEQRDLIEYLLRSFEAKHINDKNSKGKILIKKEYLRRCW